MENNTNQLGEKSTKKDKRKLGSDRSCQGAKPKSTGDGTSTKQQGFRKDCGQFGHYSKLGDPSEITRDDKVKQANLGLPQKGQSGDQIENPFFQKPGNGQSSGSSEDDDVVFVKEYKKGHEEEKAAEKPVEKKDEKVYPKCQGSSLQKVKKGGKRNRQSNDAPVITSEDDDVMFVKEYRKENENEGAVEPALKEDEPKPRRNPKRQVQIQKESYELASKLSLEYCDCGICSRKEHNVAEKSSKPTALNVSNKSDGMDETSNTNQGVKTAEKNPKAPKQKIKPKSSGKRNRKKAPPAKKKPTKVQTAVSSKESDAETYSSLHYVLLYVNNVKEYNQLIGAEKEDNLNFAKDIMLDSCILHGLVNDVSESSIAEYINSLSVKDDISGFLESFIEDIEASKADNKD